MQYDVDRYKFTCISPIGIAGPAVHPEKYGHFICWPENGQRLWAFESEAGRDKFIKDFLNAP